MTIRVDLTPRRGIIDNPEQEFLTYSSPQTVLISSSYSLDSLERCLSAMENLILLCVSRRLGANGSHSKTRSSLIYFSRLKF